MQIESKTQVLWNPWVGTPTFEKDFYSCQLLYAFHYKQLGACALNWAVEKDRDIALRNILSIPDSEIVSMMILVGHVPELVKVACSPRYNLEEVVKVIK